jgi:hypothetical protein
MITFGIVLVVFAVFLAYQCHGLNMGFWTIFCALFCSPCFIGHFFITGQGSNCNT